MINVFPDEQSRYLQTCDECIHVGVCYLKQQIGGIIRNTGNYFSFPLKKEKQIADELASNCKQFKAK